MPEYLVQTKTREAIWVYVEGDSVGQELLDKALSLHGLNHPATGVFGILIHLRDGQRRWLNLRNKVGDELTHCIALTMRVKFYTHPRQLHANARVYLYSQVLHDLRDGELKPSSPEQAIQLVALIAHAQYGPINERNINVDSIIDTYCKSLMSDTEIPQDVVLQRILDACKDMSDLSRQSAQMKLFDIASTLPLYGFERHETGKRSGIMRLRIGPSGLKVEHDREDCNESIPYSAMASIGIISCNLEIRICHDGESPRCLNVRMRNSDLAKSAYRSLVEMRTFYYDDELPESVRDMTEQSFLGALVTMFRRNSRFGMTYVFDVNATLRQISDQELRSQHTMRHTCVVRDASSRGRL